MGWCWLCVRGKLETGTDCYILTPVLLTIAALLLRLGRGYSTVGHWRFKALSAAGSQFGIFFPTDSNCNWHKPSVSRLYFCLPSTCFRCSSPYLHRCISWVTARSRVNMLQSSYSYFSKIHMWNFSSRPSPSPIHTHILQIMLKDNNRKKLKQNHLNNSKNTKKN